MSKTNKPFKSTRKKIVGGATYEQMGRAAMIRTYLDSRTHSHDKNELNNIVHSADIDAAQYKPNRFTKLYGRYDPLAESYIQRNEQLVGGLHYGPYAKLPYTSMKKGAHPGLGNMYWEGNEGIQLTASGGIYDDGGQFLFFANHLVRLYDAIKRRHTKNMVRLQDQLKNAHFQQFLLLLTYRNNKYQNALKTLIDAQMTPRRADWPSVLSIAVDSVDF